MYPFTNLEIYMMVFMGVFGLTMVLKQLIKWQFRLTKIYWFFGGVTELYAFVFTTAAIIMAFRNILTPTFVAAIGAIQAFVTANDVHNDLNTNSNTNTNVNNTTVVVQDPNAPAAPAAPPADPDTPGGPH